ncbi:right-handed parallel beta-helix repeat-containing protein [Streptomyces lavendulocolor]|uniref:right-handed parallel beta-helix repeat-containing protein n=1 Tax=Streptomyces lavendulocolor TaxID=67316 RepID=UPI003C2B20F7
MKRTSTLVVTAALLAPSAPLGLVTVGAGTAHASGRTYFVSPSGSDGNPGTSAAAPFRTIQKAADSAGPGDTVSIMNGTYSEQAKGSNVLTVRRSGRPGAPITFMAHPGHRPVIHPVNAWNGISIHGASHIAVKNLEVKGNSEALTLAGAERDAKKNDPTYNTNCIWAEPNKATGAKPHHIDIVGNTVHHCPGLGIGSRGADHMTIDRNHVYATSWYTVYATSGISILAAHDVGRGDPRTYKIRVTNNTVHDNETKVKWERCQCYSDGNGIIIDTLKDKSKAGESGPDYQGRVLVANNLSYDNGGSGIHSFKSQHVDIIHNTAYKNGRSTRMESYANIFAHDSTDVRLLNNIAYGRPGQATNSKSRNVDVTYDYNIYFGGKAPEVKGPHDIVADPKLTDPGTGAEADFRLSKGSPAIGSGTPFAAVTTDLTGARRSGGVASDRGAYGFTTGGNDATQGASGAPTDESASPGPLSTTPAEPSGGSGAAASPVAEGPAGTGDDSGPSTQNGGSGPLAETGGSNPVLPLGIAAAVLGLGGGLLFVARRKRARH